jgi:hypothetical protein
MARDNLRVEITVRNCHYCASNWAKMSEKQFSDDQLVEPEGFWPDERDIDLEPFETVPYTPDTPEYTHPEETVGSAPEPEQFADDHAGVHDHTLPAEPVAEPYFHPVAGFHDEPDPYKKRDIDEPADAAPPENLVDTRSWLNDPPPPAQMFEPREYQPPEPAVAWEPEPVQAHDPFSADPFPAKAAEDYWVGQPAYSDPNAPVYYVPETTDETVRRSGLAWSAGIAFFGSVAFMLFLGWLADLLLGTTPWGMVGGIVLGSIIGFIQFFRISSQIYGSGKNSTDYRPLLTRSDDAQDNERAPEPEPPTIPPLI